MANEMTRYYRVDTPEARAAWAVYRFECGKLDGEAKALSDAFPGSEPVFSTGFHGRSFYGLRFSTVMPLDAWTAPERQGKTQQPRTTARKITGADREQRRKAWHEARTLYESMRPTTRPNLDPVFRELGTDWGTLLFSGYLLLEREGILYLATAAEIGSPCVEMTGGDFNKATRKAVEA